MSVCIHTDTHTYIVLFCWFSSAARDQHRIAVNQIKENRRPSSFQMVILSGCLNIKFILVCNPKSFPEVCCCVCVCVFTVIMCHFLNSLAQFSGGVQTATVRVRRELFFRAANSEHFNFGLFGLWLFLFLKSVFFICNNCTFIFLYPLTPEFSPSPPSPRFYIHS